MPHDPAIQRRPGEEPMTVRVLEGCADVVLPTLAAGSAQTCVTSPPYFNHRDYGVPGQIGLEQTPAEYIARLVGVFREVRRVLRPDATLWVNIGDSYSGSGKGGNPGHSPHVKQRTNIGSPGLPPKSLIGIPWRLAFALQDDGWILRAEIIWSKANCMPESVQDRPSRSHEHLFLFSLSPRYLYDAAAIREPVAASTRNDRPNDGKRIDRGYPGAMHNGNGRLGDADERNARSVWHLPTEPYSGEHCAVMPTSVARRCILAGSRLGDVVLDPFGGAGTTGLVAERLGRSAVLVELNAASVVEARERIRNDSPLFTDVA